MTIRRWRAAAFAAAAAIMAVALATSTAASAATWQLTDQYTAYPACYTTSGGQEPLEINLSGSWSAPLSYGASGLPAGGSSSDIIYYAIFQSQSILWSTGPPPIPPGSSNGTGPFTTDLAGSPVAYAYVTTTIPAGLARSC